MRKIVVVEDDQELLKITKDYLIKSGYHVATFSRGLEAMEYLKENTIDLLILDIMLPDTDGYEICEIIRTYSRVHILMISAKHEEEDKLLGLELGADDYIEKPVSIKVLVAKINALMQRLDAGNNQSERMCDGSLVLDILSRTVTKAGEPIILSTKEFDLLHVLMNNKGRVMSKDMLFNKVWGLESDSEYATLTVHINRLRDKLEEIPKKPCGIKTVWGKGYRFEGIH